VSPSVSISLNVCVSVSLCVCLSVVCLSLVSACVSHNVCVPLLKEISPEYSLEGLMLKLKLQYFGHLMQRADSFEKTLMLGKTESCRREWQKMRWLDGITNTMDMSLASSGSWWWTGKPGMLQSMASQRVRHYRATELTIDRSFGELLM